MSVLGLVLAAGGSSRMGRPKQLAELAGRPLLEHVLAALAAAPVDRVVVALGAHAGAVRHRVGLHGASVLVVDDWAKGMGHVLARSVREHGRGHGAVVVCLGDQPLVTAAVVERLVAAWRAGAGPVVAAAYRGRPGNPKLFDRAVFDQLAALEGDAGARELLARHPQWVTLVEVGTLGSDADVDDEQALRRVGQWMTVGLGGHAAPRPATDGRQA